VVGFQHIGVGFSWLGNFDVLRSCDHSGGGGATLNVPYPRYFPAECQYAYLASAQVGSAATYSVVESRCILKFSSYSLF